MNRLYLGLIIIIILALFWYSQQPEKYIFVQGMDTGRWEDGSAYNIVPPSPVEDTPVDKLKSICNKTAGCVGFNTNGWFKSKLKPLAEFSGWPHGTTNPEDGFYYKKSALPLS